MALNNVWEDKQDGIDDILSSDINNIAHAVIEDEKGIEAISESLTQKADSVTAEGEIVRQDTLFTAGGVSANLDEWVQTASAADSKAQDNANEIEGLKEGKAEKGVLENIDIRSVSESGIYTVGYNCDGYPGDVVVSDYSSGAETLIVSKNQDTALKRYAQYLILSKPIPSTSKIYFAQFVKSENGDIVADIPWTLIYDTSKPQLTLDATLSKDGTAADAKAVGDALLEKADLSFVEKLIPRGEATGNPVTIKDSLEGMPVIGYKIYGESVQDGVPSPDSPVPIKSVGDLITEGGQSGKYKIPITIVGKNMFDEDYFVESVNSKVPPDYKVVSEIIDGKNCIKVFGLIPTGAFNFLEFSENTPYTVSFDYYDVLYNGSSGLLLTAYYTDGSTDRILPSRTSGDIWKHLSWTSAEGKTLERIGNSYSTGYAYTFFSAFQVEQGIVETSYSPYTSQEYVIYIDEPLRKVGDTADYIDYSGGQIVRNVEVVDDTGTKPIIESYTGLAEPVYTSISLPSVILPQSLMSSIEVQTSIKGDFSIKYYQDINKKLKELQSLIALNIPSTLPAEISEE